MSRVWEGLNYNFSRRSHLGFLLRLPMEKLDQKKLKPRKQPSRETWVKTKLRSCSLQWPARSEALKASRIDRGKYQCADCKESFKRHQVQLDHIEPVVDIKLGWTNWDDFINRLFCAPEGFSVLCAACHDSKTQIEDEMRTYYKKLKNGNNL